MARHSMLKIRLGALPVTEVYTPHGPGVQLVPSVRRSSQNGMIAGPVMLVEGRHSLMYCVLCVVNCRLPLELTLAVVYGVPYKVNEKGRLIVVTPSSVWLPVSSVPATTVPVAVV